MTQDGKAVDEKEWRRQNLEWERRRREADKDAEFRHQREVDKRRARMCLRQQQREDEVNQVCFINTPHEAATEGSGHRR